MIRIRNRSDSPARHTAAVTPVSEKRVDTYNLAREIVAEIEQSGLETLVLDIDDSDDDEIEVIGAEFSSAGIALIERIIAKALESEGIRS